MDINVIYIILVVIFASLLYWANDTLNSVPKLKQIVSVLIVVVAVLLIVSSLFGGNLNTHIRIA